MVRYNLFLVGEPTKSVGIFAIGIMKMIPDEIGMVGLVFLDMSVSIEVGNDYGMGDRSRK